MKEISIMILLLTIMVYAIMVIIYLNLYNKAKKRIKLLERENRILLWKNRRR
ncbi:hypothetical protein H8S33_13680 [Ornithinibacillus sp. BX22]|uniref:CcmD family protein n=2 Tax=Ornithinibacillus TaxID=484508 RepID=A0A923L7B7_9BACI|nr:MULTISPECIES: hypothetical protein [Ornithinibacillus]MBC5637857.1 hypothetical protein [Ornithinibacillus hominis]MBS3681779.1 hypothetical protein [Ornithinibacillus massiliensis]